MTTPELTRKVAQPRFWGGSLFLLLGFVSFAPVAIKQVAADGLFSPNSMALELLLITLGAWIVAGLARTRIILIAAIVTSALGFVTMLFIAS